MILRTYENKEVFVVNVLAGIAIDQLKIISISPILCIKILNDTSNHGNKQIYPFVLRFFQRYEGVQVNISDLQNQPGETSIIVDYLHQVLTDNTLIWKVVAVYGDNANVNFFFWGGVVARRGSNNLLLKSQLSVKK